MATKTDLRVVLGVDGEAKFTATMKNLAAQQKVIKAETNNATSALSLNAKEYEKTKIKAESLVKQIELQEVKVKELKEAFERSIEVKGRDDKVTLDLETKYNNATTSLNNMKTGLEKCKTAISEQTDVTIDASKELETFGNIAKKVGDKVTHAGGFLTKTLTTTILGAGTIAANEATKFEDSFAGVIKTVEGTSGQLQQLREDILEMSTVYATGANEIAGVAEAAGQMGIATEDISVFTKTMLKLGMSTDLTAEEAATALAKFSTITGVASKDYDKLGSVIVELGNKTNSTEREIVEMTQRLAATGNTVGYTAPQMLAVATSLSNVGIEAEAGGSAISKLMKKLELCVKTNDTASSTIKKTGMSLRDLEKLANYSADGFKGVAMNLGITTTELKTMMKNQKLLQQFSTIAGQSSDEFVKSYGNNAVGALDSFINGLKKTSFEGKSSVETLQDMGLTEVRLSNAILALSESEGVLGKSLKMANDEWNNSNALQNEVDKKLETTSSKLKNAKGELTKTAIIMGGNFLPAISSVAGKVGELAEKFGSLDEETQKTVIKWAIVVASAGPVIGTLGKITTATGKTAKGLSLLFKTASSVKRGTYTGPLANVLGLLSKNQKATNDLTGASKGLVGMLGPSGPLLIAFTVAAGAAVGLYKAYENVTEGDRAIADGIKKMCENFGAFGKAVEDGTNLLSGLNTEIFVNSEKQSALSESVNVVQNEITKIAKFASDERRALTDGEIKRIELLFSMLDELTKKELEGQQAYQNAVITMAKTTTDYSKENCANLISTSEETKNKTIEIAYQRQIEELALIEQTYATEEAKGSEAYQNKVKRAGEDYDLAVKSANDKHGQVLSITTEGYFQQYIVENEHLNKLFELNNALIQNDENYQLRCKQIREDGSISESEKQNQLLAAASQYKRDKKDIQKQIGQSMTDLNSEELTAWQEMSINTELYQGKITDENRRAHDNFISVYDKFPDKAKKIYSDAMQGMLDGIKEKSGALFQKATEIAGGFINSIKEKLDINSPSRVMKKLFGYTIEGGVEGVEKNKKFLLLSARKLADDFQGEFSGVEVDLGTKLSSSFAKLNSSGILRQIDFAKTQSSRLMNDVRASEVSNYYNDLRKTESNNQTNFGALLKIESLTVRNDDDIRKLAKQIEAVQRNISIGRGKW